jgi:threonine synthase
VQAEGAAPIVRGEIVRNPETIATAIRIGNPARWQEASAALDESGGHILAVNDDEILDAWRMLSTLEGVFAEPASAAGIAGLRARIARGEMDVHGTRIVSVITGHGLKDPAIVLKGSAQPVTLEPDFSEIQNYLFPK